MPLIVWRHFWTTPKAVTSFEDDPLTPKTWILGDRSVGAASSPSIAIMDNRTGLGEVDEDGPDNDFLRSESSRYQSRFKTVF